MGATERVGFWPRIPLSDWAGHLMGVVVVSHLCICPTMALSCWSCEGEDGKDPSEIVKGTAPGAQQGCRPGPDGGSLAQDPGTRTHLGLEEGW